MDEPAGPAPGRSQRGLVEQSLLAVHRPDVYRYRIPRVMEFEWSDVAAWADQPDDRVPHAIVVIRRAHPDWRARCRLL